MRDSEAAPGGEPELDALVLLGCRVTFAGELVSASARRVERARTAFEGGVAPLVVASGGRRWGNHVEACVMARALVRGGVPAAAVLEELWSFTTAENAVFSTLLLTRRLGRRPRVGIVTCSWHVRRALHAFEAAGAHAVGFGAATSRPPPLLRRVVEWSSAAIDARVARGRSGYADAARWARIGAPA